MSNAPSFVTPLPAWATRTLRAKLIGVVLATTLAALVAAMLAMGANNFRQSYKSLVADMHVQSELLGHMTAPALAFDDRQLAQQNLQLLRLQPQVAAAAIYDEQGRLFASYRRNDAQKSPPQQVPAVARTIDRRALHLATPIIGEGRLIGSVYLDVDHLLTNTALNFLLFGLGVTVAAMGFAYALSVRLQRTITGPVLHVAAVAREVMAHRDYSRRAEQTSVDEVGMLAMSFNGMLEEIERNTRELHDAYLNTAREAEERRRAEQEVLELNTALEQRVRERTAQLETSNHELQVAGVAARQASQAKSDFLANMSHEIRTPMNAIIGMAHLALKAGLDDRQGNYVQKIEQSGRHLLSLINDILDFSKIEAGKLNIERIEFDLAKVLDDVANMVQDKATAKGLELVVDVAADVPWALVGDPLRLAQVIVNYSNNAIKFTERGEIVLSIRMVEELADAVVLKFGVRDTGIGLTQEQAGRLFQSFAQADTSTTRKYGGSGLGLAITKRLAELMDGEVGVQSTLGQGSDFWFTARLGKGHARRMEPLDFSREGGRALVVDDHESARLVMLHLLKAMRFDVQAVSSGAAAVVEVENAAAGGTPYHWLFLDWQMPGMDGFETAKAIRDLHLPASPHVVMVTALDRTEALQRAAHLGIRDVLPKPVNASLLFDMIVKARDSRRGVVYTRHVPRADDKPAALLRLAGARILLVEDNAINQEVAMGLLEGFGFEIDVAPNGRVALELVQRHRYDIVLMDMQMPVMDGVEATLAMRSDPRLQDLPIVAMTANAMQQDLDRCKAAGMVDSVTKPIEPARLWRALEKWIRPHAGLGQARDIPVGQQAAAGAEEGSVPGLDQGLGLSHVMGRKTLYRSMLEKFAQTQRDAVARIVSALDRRDLDTAVREVHTLRGLAGTIGAKALQRQAADLEAALHAQATGERIAQLLRLTEQALQPLVDALLAQQPAASGQAPPALDMEQFVRVCDEVVGLLLDSDAQAMEVWTTHQELMRLGLRRHYASAAHAMERYDFGAALEILQSAMVKSH